MARTYWTDDRLDSAFAELRQELREFRLEMRSELGAVRADISDLRKQMLAGSIAIIVALIGVIGAVLVAQ